MMEENSLTMMEQHLSHMHDQAESMSRRLDWARRYEIGPMKYGEKDNHAKYVEILSDCLDTHMEYVDKLRALIRKTVAF